MVAGYTPACWCTPSVHTTRGGRSAYVLARLGAWRKWISFYNGKAPQVPYFKSLQCSKRTRAHVLPQGLSAILVKCGARVHRCWPANGWCVYRQSCCVYLFQLSPFFPKIIEDGLLSKSQGSRVAAGPLGETTATCTPTCSHWRHCN